MTISLKPKFTQYLLQWAPHCFAIAHHSLQQIQFSLKVNFEIIIDIKNE